MNLILQFGAIFAALVLMYLLWLLLFERGAFYRTSEAVHQLDDAGRMRLLTSLLASPTQSIESLRVIRNGAGFYEEQAAAIRSATRSVHLETYIFRSGHAAQALLDAMCERARAGVPVRVVIDAVGSFRTRSSIFAALVAAGGQICRYHPLSWHTFRRWNSRTHRNLLVLDGTIAFIGGAGVADHWGRLEAPAWRDFAVRVTGPVVAGLQAVFAENWLEGTGEILVGPEVFPHVSITPREGLTDAIAVGSTPTAGLSTRARMVVQFLLATARDSVELCSPYFIPDLGIRRELLAAHARGVRIRILTGGPYGDHGIVRRAGRRRYGTLLRAGIEIWEYDSLMMHAKLLVIDGRWSLVGSTNIDHRSFGLNDEVNLVIASARFAAELQGLFEEYLAGSVRLDLQGWLRRPIGERLLATLGRVIERHQ
jgi:cardiolipin synthase A/B